MRRRLTDVLDLLASGLSQEDILNEMSDLELEDIKTCLQYASNRMDHPVLKAA